MATSGIFHDKQEHLNDATRTRGPLTELTASSIFPWPPRPRLPPSVVANAMLQRSGGMAFAI